MSDEAKAIIVILLGALVIAGTFAFDMLFYFPEREAERIAIEQAERLEAEQIEIQRQQLNALIDSYNDFISSYSDNNDINDYVIELEERVNTLESLVFMQYAQ